MSYLYETFALTGVVVTTIAISIWATYHVGSMLFQHLKDNKRP